MSHKRLDPAWMAEVHGEDPGDPTVRALAKNHSVSPAKHKARARGHSQLPNPPLTEPMAIDGQAKVGLRATAERVQGELSGGVRAQLGWGLLGWLVSLLSGSDRSEPAHKRND